MYRKNIKFKSIIFKVLFTYSIVYLIALIFKYNYDFESILATLNYKYLIILNIVSISLGLPLSIIFDFILIRVFGLHYVLFFTPVLTIIGVIQVLILRKINFKFDESILILKNFKKNNFYKMFRNDSFKPFYILIIRTFPILPFLLGSYFISRSKSKKIIILGNSFLGSFLYYLFLFIIIK